MKREMVDGEGGGASEKNLQNREHCVWVFIGIIREKGREL